MNSLAAAFKRIDRRQTNKKLAAQRPPGGVDVPGVGVLRRRQLRTAYAEMQHMIKPVPPDA